MNETLKADIRKEFGKGAARRLRREEKLPGVLYGHEEEPMHLELDYHTTFLAVRGNANALLSIEVEGEKHLAIVKDVQRNPLSRLIEHIDLLRVKKGEKVDVEVPVVVEGEPAGDAIATVELLQVMAKAPAIAIPEAITVNVEGLEEGTHVTVADLKLPEDVEVELDPETIVVVIAVPSVDVPEEAEESEEAAE
ncbi:50S ribosomal protein L25/general stress protein Ctc [Arcanobacterium haemolyticum]|uniref:Large ribosomal subunit protein bL25 n=1 Tax=Arcanobacterium haemolyticum (strain ATCC 9345 / DSM 20595 / CCM 5947 / CCUG 17215 / LMG 16163 / NBRC 15585 / NCTC 8452 / 11018) TaxID=644284 RepID=D7BKN8_ARCHD|nr:50S ribosomal protein L25/general stress protein Ctc [Arcanobacterium haemolyticum]ADH93218.1 ribosomal 5S rRNA E-loop binding protein Ctc/L25/TL5 [Arcanobacterium haemolyticum DSM 20595]QCX47264.1 50S ribosomal protein L25/general stress protein Ctc [Arcanobacterium haemolyticum]SQH28020.1 50S ribosomal protein L25 [Arcanobacterium haemolyticum]